MAIRTWCLALAVLLSPAAAMATEHASDIARIEEKINRLEMQLDRLQAVIVELCTASASSGAPPAFARLQDKELQTRVYNLVDLVEGDPKKFDGDGWITLIKKAVPKATWKSDAGEGTISPFPTNLAVVVSQTPEVHTEIANYLADLRELKERLEKAGVEVKVGPPARQDK